MKLSKRARRARREFYRQLKWDRDLPDRINNLTSEEIAQVMERLPTDALEFAVRFEALSHRRIS